MQTITVDQAARLAKVEPEAIRERIRNGAIPDRRANGARRMVLFRSDVIKEDDKSVATMGQAKR